MKNNKGTIFQINDIQAKNVAINSKVNQTIYKGNHPKEEIEVPKKEDSKLVKMLQFIRKVTID